MRFLVGKDAFVDSLAWGVKILPARSPIPILDTVLLRVMGDVLEIVATNMDISVRQRIAVAEAEDGEIAVPGKLLFSTVQSLRGPSLQFTLEDRTLHLKHDGGKYRFMGFPADEFPRVRELPEDAPELRVRLKDLKEGLSTVAFCAAKDDPRTFLTGIYWEIKNEEMRLVASDSQRLGFWRHEVPAGGEAQAIISRPTGDLLRALSGDEIGVRIKDDFIYISHETGYVLARLIPGPYAPYESVIPQDPGNELLLNKDDLADAMKRALDFAEPPLSTVRLTLRESSCHLEAHSAAGSLEEEVSGEYRGPEMTLGLSGRMFMDALKALPSERVRIRIYSPSSPLRMEPESYAPGKELLYLTVPLQLEEEFAEEEMEPEPAEPEEEAEF